MLRRDEPAGRRETTDEYREQQVRSETRSTASVAPRPPGRRYPCRSDRLKSWGRMVARLGIEDPVGFAAQFSYRAEAE
jgi:hypothetical protein